LIIFGAKIFSFNCLHQPGANVTKLFTAVSYDFL
jgi:hypothetical protein